MQNFRKSVDEAIIDENMKNQVEELMSATIGYQLNPNLFIIKSQISPLCPLGFVHVYVTDLGKIDCGFRCYINFFHSHLFISSTFLLNTLY